MIIETKKLWKKYKNENVINYPDLVFESGKSYLILGKSGCGKSTLLNIIAGVLSAEGGEVHINGANASLWDAEQKDTFRVKNIGYIYQDFKLIPEMTVADNIGILRLENVNVSGMDALLDKLGILEKKNKKVKNLSGGQKQRVAIARALVKNPPIILADEPTGNLNFEIGNQIISDLVENSRDKVLIVVSHEEKFAHFFDEVIRLGGEENV